MKKLFTSFILALISYSMVVGQCGTPVDTISENFDASSNLPNCWTINATNGNGLVYVLNNSGYSVSGTNSLRMGHAGGSGTSVLYAVLPMVTNASGDLSFYARTDGSNPVQIGTMSDPNNTASFSLIQTVSPTNSYQLFTVNMAAYTGANQYVAFRYNMPSGKWMVLDDVTYTAALTGGDPCATPSLLIDNMESYPDFDSDLGCWTTYVSNANGAIYILNNTNYAASGVKALRIGASGSSGASTLFAVTPKVAGLNGIMTFQARTDGSAPLLVGTMPNATDTASFEVFDTIQHNSIYQEYTVDFTSYIGLDSFIAFKYEMPGGVWTLLDDINISVTTSVSTIPTNQTLNIYPNPASTSITLDTKEIIESVSIYNLNGQLVKFVGQAENVIDIQDLPKGLYIVQAQTAKGIYQNKIIKN